MYPVILCSVRLMERHRFCSPAIGVRIPDGAPVLSLCSVTGAYTARGGRGSIPLTRAQVLQYWLGRGDSSAY